MSIVNVYQNAMDSVRRVYDAANEVLNEWRQHNPEWAKSKDTSKSYPTDESLCEVIRLRLGDQLDDITDNLRIFARHVLVSHESATFRTDWALLRYLLCEETQRRFREKIPDPPSSGEKEKTLVAAHGYDFQRVYSWSQFHNDILVHYPGQREKSPSAEWRKIFNKRLSEAKGQPWVYVPEARYDEIFIEVLTGTWLALFFLGERYDVLWSVVARTAANETGGLPSGCAVLKAYGDVYREMREAAEEILFRRGEGNLLNSNCRVRSIVHWPVFLGESFFEVNEHSPFDLTPPYLRALGSLYLYWQGLRYVRMGLPITLLTRRSQFEKSAPSFEDSGKNHLHSEEWKRMRSWFRLAFGDADDEFCGPVSTDTRNYLSSNAEPCTNWVAWYSMNVDPNQIHPDLRFSRHTVVLAIKDEEINKLELQNAACGPRIGAASGGNVIKWTHKEQASEPSRLAGELPFSGRRLYGDILASYNYAFRLLARQGRDWIENGQEEFAIDVMERVYARNGWSHPRPTNGTQPSEE